MSGNKPRPSREQRPRGLKKSDERRHESAVKRAAQKIKSKKRGGS